MFYTGRIFGLAAPGYQMDEVVSDLLMNDVQERGRKGVLKVVSPIYKQNFNLKTGECLDDATVKIPVYPVRVVDGQVQIQTGG